MMCKMHTCTPSSMREKNPNIPCIRTPPQLQQCFTTSVGTNTTLLAIVAKAPAMYSMYQQVMSCTVTLKLLTHHLIHSTKYRACTGPLLAPNPCLLSLCTSPLTPTLGFKDREETHHHVFHQVLQPFLNHLPPSLGTKSATENHLWSFSDIELSSEFKEGMFPQLLLFLYQFQSPKPHNV